MSCMLGLTRLASRECFKNRYEVSDTIAQWSVSMYVYKVQNRINMSQIEWLVVEAHVSC